MLTSFRVIGSRKTHITSSLSSKNTHFLLQGVLNMSSPMFVDTVDDFVPPTRKRKSKSQDNSNVKTKKKRPNLKLNLVKKEGMTQTTLDRWLFKPKTATRVRFVERVLLKVYTKHSKSWTLVPLKGFSEPHSAFALERAKVKRHMARKHYWKRQRPTAYNARKVTHILKTIQRENTKLGY